MFLGLFLPVNPFAGPWVMPFLRLNLPDGLKRPLQTRLGLELLNLLGFNVLLEPVGKLHVLFGFCFCHRHGLCLYFREFFLFYDLFDSLLIELMNRFLPRRLRDILPRLFLCCLLRPCSSLWGLGSFPRLSFFAFLRFQRFCIRLWFFRLCHSSFWRFIFSLCP